MPKRKAYTVREKLELITRIRNGESQAKVARETSIADSTLRGWLKCEREKLEDYLDDNQTLASFVDTWAEIDTDMGTDEQLTDDQLVDEAKATVAVSDDDMVPDATEEVPVMRPTAAEAVAGLQTALSWIEGEDTSYLTVMQLGNLLRIAKTARLASRRQKKVTDYFTA